jgi:hypothetical protein
MTTHSFLRGGRNRKVLPARNFRFLLNALIEHHRTMFLIKARPRSVTLALKGVMTQGRIETPTLTAGRVPHGAQENQPSLEMFRPSVNLLFLLDLRFTGNQGLLRSATAASEACQRQESECALKRTGPFNVGVGLNTESCLNPPTAGRAKKVSQANK